MLLLLKLKLNYVPVHDAKIVHGNRIADLRLLNPANDSPPPELIVERTVEDGSSSRIDVETDSEIRFYCPVIAACRGRCE